MYQVLYRKYRPRTFAEVVGQSAVTAALLGELRAGRPAHAYLFAGSRGTGKTTCAKIFAKAVNCLSPKDGEPCGECAICRGIDDGSVLDVVEIDAASNNGVDNIRDLRDEVHYMPALAKYRVYIIDEVHMLSPGAFNALLKTLEEPPAHAVFILATTEAHKLPATILSRCQRFTFGRIAPAAIAERLQTVAKNEAIELDDDAALLLARLADGAMRDALSLLDQCRSHGEHVTAAAVADTAGLAGDAHLFALADNIRSGDGAAALSLLDTLYDGGADMERLCAELIEHFRQLMIAKTVKAPGDLLALTPAGVDALTKQAAAVSLPGILYCLDAWQIAYERMRTAASRRVEMELALMRLCAAKGEPPFAAAVAGVSIASHTAVGAVNAPPKTATVKLVPPKDTTDGAAVAAARAEAIESTAPVGSTASSTVPPALSPDETPFAQWPNVLHILSGTCPPLFAVLDASSAVLRGDMVLIQTDNPLFRSLLDADSNKKALSSAVRQATGKDDIRIGARKPAAPPASGEDALTALLRQAREKGVEVKED